MEISFSISYNSKRETLSPSEKQKLLLDFFEEFANIRHNCHNVLQSSRVLQLAELIPQIDSKKLTAHEIQDLAKNFDLIGFNCAAIFSKPETANIFLENGLGKLTSAKYHGAKWIKNSIHFLVHCKNLGLLGAGNSQETKGVIISIINEISQFIAENSDNLNFNESDAQASLDILL